MKRRSLAVIILVILVCIGLVSYFALESFNAFVPKYVVHLQEGYPGLTGNYYYFEGLLVVYEQNNKIVGKCFLGDTGYFTVAATENITLAEGPYTVNIYDSISGLFIQTLDIYVANETSLVLGPYNP